MSVLHVNHIKSHLDKYYQEAIDMSKYQPDKKEDYKNRFYSKAQAAYAINILTNEEPNKIGKYVIDGGDDNGIDCVYIDSTENMLYFVQSKWINDGNAEPSSGDVKKFADGIRDLVNLKFDRFNNDLNRFATQIRSALEDSSTRYMVVLVYTGINGPAVHSQRTLDDLLSEMNDAGDLMKMKIIKQKDLHSAIASGLNNNPITLNIGLKNFGKHGPVKAFYGLLNCSSVASWWNEYGDRLFSKNIRGVLGDSEVNNEIQSTLAHEVNNFWYFNNGITIIADKVEKTLVGGGNTDFGTFTCENISIVNGAQTVSTIGKYASDIPESVKDGYVHCRVIELESAPENFGMSITKCNNRQNRIENRDFVTQDPEQLRIKIEATIEGFDYILVRSSNSSMNEKTFDVVNSTTALACLTMIPAIFVLLKREISKLWDDIGKSPYKQLFNANVTGNYVIKAVLTQQKIDNEIFNLQKSGKTLGKKSAILIHGNRMIAAIIYKKMKFKYLLNDNKIDEIELKNVNEELVFEIVNKITEEIERLYGNPIIPTLFKNLSKCTAIFNAIKV
jgi:hypothetical protein